MVTWSVKALGDSLAAEITTAEIERCFKAVAQPPTATVYILTQPGEMHCEVLAYFSPAAAELANQFGAMPCNPPSQFGLQVLVGHLHPEG